MNSQRMRQYSKNKTGKLKFHRVTVKGSRDTVQIPESRQILFFILFIIIFLQGVTWHGTFLPSDGIISRVTGVPLSFFFRSGPPCHGEQYRDTVGCPVSRQFLYLFIYFFWP